MARPKAAHHEPSIPEEQLEFSNVTDLRQNLLPAIERIEKNPALRFLILKHGRPQAVLMSAETYDLVKKLMNQLVSAQASMPRAAAIEGAFRRLRDERGTRANPAPSANEERVSQQIELMTTMLFDIKKQLRARKVAKAESGD